MKPTKSTKGKENAFSNNEKFLRQPHNFYKLSTWRNMMTMPRMTIVLIFLFGILTGCHTPLIDVHVEVRSGVQPGYGGPHGPDGPGGGCPPPPYPQYLCGGGATPAHSGVLVKIHGAGEVKVYEVEIEGPTRKLYFSVPPDEVESGLKEKDPVDFVFMGTKNKLIKRQ